MKKYILFLTTLFLSNILSAQTLYTENFNSYPVGNLGTDTTGNTPGLGGWYTFTGMDPSTMVGPNSDYKIVTEAGRGNILEIGAFDINRGSHDLNRKDLKTYWQQRTPGNNILKFSFDIYTGDGIGRHFRMHLFSDEGRLVSYMFNPIDRGIRVETSYRGSFSYNSTGVPILPNNKGLTSPKNTWITLELYIDYDNSNIYFSIPYYGYTILHKTHSLYLGGLDKDGNPYPDDSPVRLMVWENKISNTQTYITKLDNINISAQSTIPTVSVNEFFSDQFNLYPNPATNIVNITNNDNMFVNQVQVYDLSGKLINTQTFNSEAEIQLNVETLTSGIYILHLQTGQGIAVKKLIKK